MLCDRESVDQEARQMPCMLQARAPGAGFGAVVICHCAECVRKTSRLH